MAGLAGQFMTRLEQILAAEQVTADKALLAEVIMKYLPDWRRVINECQRFSINGKLDTSIINTSDHNQYNDLLKHLKNKDFKKMRAWVVNNIDVDASAIFRGIYDRMVDSVQPTSIPQLVLILADYQYKNAFVADHELNIVACMTEVMSNVEFK
jgi:hypothetical protein